MKVTTHGPGQRIIRERNMQKVMTHTWQQEPQRK